MKIPTIIHDNKFELTDYWRIQIRKAVKDNGAPIRAEIQTLLPESRKMRGYVMGCLIPLLVYLDGNEYKDSKTCDRYFEHYKKEFTPELLKINGKIHTFGASSKGAKSLNVFAEKLQDYLSEHYSIGYDNKVISPDFYKEWRDNFSMESVDTFIEYCEKLKLIKV